MKIIRRPAPNPKGVGTALTIGNFDGVHSGHAALCRAVVSHARQAGLKATVVTFNPHPKEFFSAEFKLPRITTFRNRISMMKHLGVDQVCVLPFDRQLCSLSPEGFVERVLVGQLNAREVWVGDDFRFGAKRAGDFALLQQLGPNYGFNVFDLEEVKTQGTRVSSSNIRNALALGDLNAARALLGHELVYSGHVLHGKKLGRTLGFPTMNLRLGGRDSALHGILAVWVHGLSNSPLPAVASLGVRPTVEQAGEVLLETYIPNWNGNAYGKLIHIEVMAHIRPELKFDSLPSMVEQMKTDTANAMSLLQQAQYAPTLRC